MSQFYEQFDDDEIGALDNAELEGYLNPDSMRLDEVLKDYFLQKEKEWVHVTIYQFVVRNLTLGLCRYSIIGSVYFVLYNFIFAVLKYMVYIHESQTQKYIAPHPPSPTALKKLKTKIKQKTNTRKAVVHDTNN